MNQAVRQRLLSDAGERASAHPANAERALQYGMNQFRRRLAWTYVAVIAGVLALVVSAAVFAGVTRSAAAPDDAPLVVDVSIDPGAATVSAGHALQVAAAARSSDGTTRDVTSQASWASSDPQVATVEPAGAVSANKPGTAVITATYEGQVGTATLTVSAQEATPVAVRVTPESTSATVGEGWQFTAVASYSDTSTKDVTKDAKWASSDRQVATVDAAGRATARRAGTATITAIHNGNRGTATLTVVTQQPRLVSVEVKPRATSVRPGEARQVTAFAHYSDTTSQDVTSQASWDSSDPQVATVDAAGRVNAIKPGTAVITATHEGQQGKATLTVSVQERTQVAVRVTPGSVSLAAGQQQFKATASYSDKSTEDVTRDTNTTWASSDPQVATVDGSGQATAKGVGTVTITATHNGLQGTATLEVKPPG